jgi:hypothetical protein
MKPPYAKVPLGISRTPLYDPAVDLRRYLPVPLRFGRPHLGETKADGRTALSMRKTS